MSGDKVRKYLIPNIPYLLAFWFFCKFGEAYRLTPGADWFRKLIGSSNTLGKVMATPLPSFNSRDLLIGVIGAVVVYAIVYFKKKNAKKWRQNVEYGSARWGNSKDIAPYVDPKPENNVILTQTESLMMNPRHPSPKYARNKNGAPLIMA